MVFSAYAYSGYGGGLVVGSLSSGALLGGGAGGGYLTTADGGAGGGIASFAGSGSGGGFLTRTSFSGGRAGLGALPIVRTQKVDFIRVPQQPQAVAVEPAQLLVDSQMNPISLVYRSHGAPINIVQKHIPSQGTFRQSQSEEEPTRHLHVIRKPGKHQEFY